jgi:F-type H+-transporting ATPase subunit delta
MQDRLKRALDVSTGKDCILEPRVDPRIIGGVVAVLGDRVIDGSLRSSLDELRKDLMSAPLQ